MSWVITFSFLSGKDSVHKNQQMNLGELKLQNYRHIMSIIENHNYVSIIIGKDIFTTAT